MKPSAQPSHPPVRFDDPGRSRRRLATIGIMLRTIRLADAHHYLNRRDLIVHFPAERSSAYGHEGLKWVDLTRSPAGLRTAVVRAKPGVQGGGGELPLGVDKSHSRSVAPLMPQRRACPTVRWAVIGNDIILF